MDFLKNIAINLKATGPAAVTITWLLCITALGMFGQGRFTALALGILAGCGAGLIAALGRPPRE